MKWAAVIIVGFIAGAYYLARDGRAQQAAAGEAAQHSATGERAQPKAPPPKQKALDPRGAYVQRVNRLQNRIGRQIEATMGGPDNTVLTWHWKKADPEHFKQLQGNEGFERLVRNLGFKKVIFVVEGKKVRELTL